MTVPKYHKSKGINNGIVLAQSATGEPDWKQEMESAFNEFLNLIQDDNTISAYELQSSGLVQALFTSLNVSVVL